MFEATHSPDVLMFAVCIGTRACYEGSSVHVKEKCGFCRALPVGRVVRSGFCSGESMRDSFNLTSVQHIVLQM